MTEPPRGGRLRFIMTTGVVGASRGASRALVRAGIVRRAIFRAPGVHRTPWSEERRRTPGGGTALFEGFLLFDIQVWIGPKKLTFGTAGSDPRVMQDIVGSIVALAIWQAEIHALRKDPASPAHLSPRQPCAPVQRVECAAHLADRHATLLVRICFTHRSLRISRHAGSGGRFDGDGIAITSRRDGRTHAARGPATADGAPAASRLVH